MAAYHSDVAVEFVYCSVTLNTNVVFGNALTPNQTRFSIVARFCINLKSHAM